MNRHSWKVLTNHKSHAHWPFLTKMFMHSYDLIKATLKNKRQMMRRKELSTKLFKTATRSHSCSSPVSSIHSLLLDTLFPDADKSPLCTAGTFHSRSISDELLSVLFKLGFLCHRMSVLS